MCVAGATANPVAIAAATRCGCPVSTSRSTTLGNTRCRLARRRCPNGILSVAEFEFVSPGWPSDLTITEGIVRLDIRWLDDPDRTFWNIYDHGRFEGTERVGATLVFDVLHHDPGAVLSIEDLVVR